MKLDEARVTNFRCINDSSPFTIGQVACLVGKNESGKTSILHALAKLNSADANLANFDKERDYPRHMLTEFDEKKQVLETKWMLSEDDVAAVERVLGPGSLASKWITVLRDYTNARTWQIQVDEEKIVTSLLSQAGCEATERHELGSSASVKELATKAEPLKANSKRVATMFEQISKWREKDPSKAAIDVLQTRMPKLLYFASYDRMNGSVSLEHLRQSIANKTLTKNDSVFLAFLDFAGTALDELAKLDKYEAMKARVEAASIKISKRIFKYWSQNRHLKVQFSLEAGRPGDAPPFNSGTIMRTRILNALHEMTVSLRRQKCGVRLVLLVSRVVFSGEGESRGRHHPA